MKFRTNFITTGLLTFILSGWAISQTQIESVKSNLTKLSKGGEAGGGGDDCENRFKVITEDIREWIIKGGSKNLSLPSNITSEIYDEKMLEVIDIIRSKNINPSAIECTDDKIIVNGTEKTCDWKNNVDNASVPFRIRCNYNRFMDGVSDENPKLGKEDAQYQLGHHEIAGIAEIEGGYYDRSNYDISNQIVASLESFVVKKLAVKKIKITPPSKGCNLFIDANKSKKYNKGFKEAYLRPEAENILRASGYKLVKNRKNSDITFSIEGYHRSRILTSNLYIMRFSLNHNSGFKFSNSIFRNRYLIKEELEGRKITHHDNMIALTNKSKAKSADEYVKYQAQYDSSKDIYIKAKSLWEIYLPLVPTCSAIYNADELSQWEDENRINIKELTLDDLKD